MIKYLKRTRIFTLLTTLILTICLIGSTSVAQAVFQFDENHKCSRTKRFQSYKNQKDIIQTPLLHDYDVKFYHFNLDIENNTTYLQGNVKYIAEVKTEELDTFAFELIDDMVLDSILINNTLTDYYRSDNEVFSILSSAITQGQQFTAQIYYHGTPPEGEFFNGVTLAYDSTWNKSVVWTLSEPFNARQWWPTKQVLTDKADSVWVFLTTSSDNMAGSVGMLTNVVNLPNNKVRYEWKSNYPIAYYLISYAVAEYQDYSIYAKPQEMAGDSILVQNFVYNTPGCLEYHKGELDRTSTLIELFSDLYTLYPFYEEKYGHCITMLSGGMEHQTMTTIGTPFALGLVSHELAHMWFGDNVTCATWSDIWVNEGFATYSDYLAHEKVAASIYAPKWLKGAHNYVTSISDGSVYVPPEEVEYGNENRIFSSRLTYFKGALVLHMVRYELNNDELFFQAFKNFQVQFKDSVATSQDFIDVLNSTTGQDFTEFFNQWFFGEGFPLYNIDWAYSDNVLEIISEQSASVPEVTPFFEMDLPVKIFFDDNTDTTIAIEHTQPLVTKTVNINTGVDSIQIDPELWVLKQVESINNIPELSGIIDILAFPNPVVDVLHIQSDYNRAFTGSIVDLNGETMLTFSTENFNSHINLESFESGVYFLIIESDKGKTIEKIVKH